MFAAYAETLTFVERQSRAATDDALPQLFITKEYGATQEDAARLVHDLNTKRSDYGVDKDGVRVAPTALAALNDRGTPDGELIVPHLNSAVDVPREMSAQEIVLAQLSDLDLVLETTTSQARGLLSAFQRQHDALYKAFLKVKRNANERRHAPDGTDPFSLDQSLKATFALTHNAASNQLKKALRTVFAPLVELLARVPPHHYDLFHVAERRRLITEEWPRAIDSPEHTVAAHIDFDRGRYVKESAPGAGSFEAVSTVLQQITHTGRPPSDVLAERLNDYCRGDPDNPDNNNSLLALELANDRAYYAASADAYATMEAALARIWRAVATAWHEWHALWAVLAIRSHRQYIVGSTTADRSAKKDAHKRRLSTLAQWMTQRRANVISTDEEPFKTFFDELFARSAPSPPPSEAPPSSDSYLDGLDNKELARVAAFYQSAVVAAWKETASAYNEAKQRVEAYVRRHYPGDDNEAESRRQQYRERGMAVLRSPVRALWRLVDAWVREVHELEPLREAGALVLVDELLHKSSGSSSSLSSSLSSTTSIKQRQRANCFRSAMMRRFWHAWLYTSPSTEFVGIESVSLDQVTTLHSSVTTVYAYANLDMYEHTG